MQKTQGSWGGADSLQSAVSREAFRGYPKLKGAESSWQWSGYGLGPAASP